MRPSQVGLFSRKTLPPGFGCHVGRNGESGACEQRWQPEADHRRVVDHRHRHEHDVGGAITQAFDGQRRIQQIVVLHPRDDLRHPGGTARELKYRYLVRIARNGEDVRVRPRRGFARHHVLEPHHPVARVATQRDDVTHGRDARLHLQRKRLQIEFRVVPLHDVRARVDVTTWRPDLGSSATLDSSASCCSAIPAARGSSRSITSRCCSIQRNGSGAHRAAGRPGSSRPSCRPLMVLHSSRPIRGRENFCRIASIPPWSTSRTRFRSIRPWTLSAHRTASRRDRRAQSTRLSSSFGTAKPSAIVLPASIRRPMR